jgi:hypothetical protein
VSGRRPASALCCGLHFLAARLLCPHLHRKSKGKDPATEAQTQARPSITQLQMKKGTAANDATSEDDSVLSYESDKSTHSSEKSDKSEDDINAKAGEDSEEDDKSVGEKSESSKDEKHDSDYWRTFWREKKVPELRSECKKKGLGTTGSKQVLVERLTAHSSDSTSLNFDDSDTDCKDKKGDEAEVPVVAKRRRITDWTTIKKSSGD